MTILVPLDFSARSASALEFAATMASSCGGEICLVHVLAPEAAKEQSEPPEIARVLSDLINLQKNLENAFGIHSSLEVAEGTVPDEILRIAQTLRPDLIVMASRGSYTDSSSILASTTSQVMEASVVPVLAVPFGSRYTPPSRIVFGTENEDADISRIQALIDFANLNGAQIEVVHVVNRFGDEEDSASLRKVERFREGLTHSVSYPFIHCEEYQHTDVAEGMLCFVEEQHADLLVLSSKHKTLVERLVRGNLNNEYAYQLEVPLLCIHDPSPAISISGTEQISFIDRIKI